MRCLRLGAVLLLSAALTACGDPSRSEILDKAAGADTRDKLESALGRPDDLAKVGPLERWKYKAADGEVIFIITGETVALEVAGSTGQN